MSQTAVSPLLLAARRLTQDGVDLVRAGQLTHGLDALREAATLLPAEPAVHSNLAVALERAGAAADAFASWYQALLRAPERSAAYRALAAHLARAGQAEAAALAERAADTVAASSVMHPDAVEAIETLRRAVAPHDIELLTRLGGHALDHGAEAAAVGYFRQACALQPDTPGLRANLLLAYRRAGLRAEAMALAEAMLASHPEQPAARFHKGQMLLETGDYAAAWPYFDAHWAQDRAFSGTPDWVRRDRLWDGRPPADQVVGLWPGGGHGDALQFVRYVPLLAERGISAVLAVQPALVRLFRQSGFGDVRDITEPADFPLCCPLVRLPALFGTTLATIPAAPYLRADAAAVAAWRDRLSGPEPRVGLVWAGAAGTDYDARRSLPLTALEPLLRVGGVRFVSLQVGAAVADPRLLDIAPDLSDFADTAAAIAALDLVIAVDTAVAHLAGGLGRPTWLLNRFDSCWRWLAGRADSPWYPSLRIFQQAAPGDWAGVVDAAAAALSSWAAARRPECVA